MVAMDDPGRCARGRSGLHHSGRYLHGLDAMIDLRVIEGFATFAFLGWVAYRYFTGKL